MIKRYSVVEISKETSAHQEGALEDYAAAMMDKKYALYTDIAPLEAKAALFDEAIAALKGVKEILNSDAVIGIFACAANHHCVYTGPTTDKLIEPLLTRARAMEGK